MRLRDSEGRFKSPQRDLRCFNQKVVVVDEGGAKGLLEAIHEDDLKLWTKTQAAPLPPAKKHTLLLTKTALHVLCAEMKSITRTLLNP